MNREQYILKELEMMRADCRKDGISPEEWIQTNAVQYSSRHVKKLDPQRNSALDFWFVSRFFFVLGDFFRKVFQPFKVNRVRKHV